MQNRIKQSYQSTHKALSTIYRKRKRTIFYQKILWSITGLFFLLMLSNMVLAYFPTVQIPFLDQFSASVSNPYSTTYFMVALVILLYPAIFLFWKAFQTFKIKENETIVQMVKQLFPEVDFAQNTMPPTKEIIKSKLFTGVETETLIYNYGQIRNKTNDAIINITDIGIIEENVEHKLSGTLARIPILSVPVMLYQYVFKNIFTRKTADNVQFTFRGMFCWLRFKKSLNGHTVVLPKAQSTKFNRFLTTHFKEEQRIQLEDPRFTDTFLVYSTDQIEARYVLSTALMERILELKQKFDQPIGLSFQDKEMYLAVQNQHGLFSFPSGKLDNIKIIEELANDIDTALKVSTILKVI